MGGTGMRFAAEVSHQQNVESCSNQNPVFDVDEQTTQEGHTER